MFFRRYLVLGWLGLVLVSLTACDLPTQVDVVVLTGWSPSEQLTFEQSCRQTPGLENLRWRWLVATPADDPPTLAKKASGCDLLIGLPQAIAIRLASPDRLLALNQLHPGFVVESGAVQVVSWEGLNTPSLREQVVFDDPRRDWTTFLCLRAALPPGDWDRRYGSLVLAAGQAQRPGRGPTVAEARVERGEARLSTGLGIEGARTDGTKFVTMSEVEPVIQVAALLDNAPHPQTASKVIAALETSGLASRVSLSKPTVNDGDYLLAELLGATLRDAQDEIRNAIEAISKVESAERRATLLRFLTELPPWPPASIEKLKLRDDPGRLLTTLAAELSPTVATREWLLARWRESEAPIDEALLTRLAQAEDGRLAGEPRFRNWLRAEWTAWARQRYRRVARSAAGAIAP